MEFTGERYIPDNDNVDQELGIEHLNRYYAVLPFVAGKKVLDAACGVGYGAKILAGQASHVTGVDIDAETITYAKKHYQAENVEYFVDDVQKIPIKSSSFDVAVSFETVEHLSKKKQDKFLHDLKRVLKKAGVLIISTPDKQHYSDEYNYHNKFHKKEFQHDEFVNFLQSRFKYVEVYYQFFEVCNLLTHNTSHSLEFLQKKAADASSGKYMVAVCSDIPWGSIDFSGLQILTGEYGRRTRRILQLQDEVEERNQWAANLNEEIVVLRERIDSLLQDLVQAQQELVKRTTEVAELNTTAQNQTIEADKTRERNAALKAELKQAKKEHVASVDAISHDLAQRTTEVTELNTTVQNQTIESEKTRERNAALKAELKQAKKEHVESVAAVSQELAQSTTEVNELNSTILSQTIEAEKTRERNAALKTELEQAKKEHVASVDTIRQELVQRTATVEHQSAEVQKIHLRATELQAVLDQATRQEEETAENLAEAKSFLEAARVQIESDKMQVGSLEAKQQQINKEYSQLGEIHRSVIHEKDGLRAQLESATLNVEESKTNISCQQQMIDQQVVQLEELNKVVHKVSKKSKQKVLLASNIEAFHHLRRKCQDQLYTELNTFKSLKDALRINKVLKSIKARKKEYDRLFDRLPRRFVEYFDSGQYLQVNQDVAEAIANGDFENALEHFVFFGYTEIAQGGRRLYEECGYFDETKYLNAHDDVRNAIKKDAFNSAFEHFLMFGCFEIIAGDRNRADADSSCKNNLDLFDPESVYLSQAMSLTVPSFAQPMVTIIIPAYNQAKYTFACIESIIANTQSTPYEIIVADDRSPDHDARNIKHLVSNITFVENEENLGFLKNCNNAAKMARGKYILFLNNDTNVQPRWLGRLVSLIESDETIGMVGSKLVYPDGRQQEAGGIIWRDGSGWNFGRLDDPEKPEYNYVKDVDYLSGAAIMIKQKLWNEIGGFDERYAPAYFEDSDLAFEVRKHGYRVKLQPESVVVHFEGISHGTDTDSGIKKYQQENLKKFIAKWKNVLELDHFDSGHNVFNARDRSRHKKTILVIDHYVPHFDQDAGSRTVFAYLKLFVKNGYNVKFIGDNYFKHEPYTKILQQCGVEVLYGSWYADNWKEWISENANNFDYILMNRPHITEKYIDHIHKVCSGKLIYYGHDLHFLREARAFALNGKSENKRNSEMWREKEFSIMRKCFVSLYPSQIEIDEISRVDSKVNALAVPAYIYDNFPVVPMEITDTSDIMFVGGFAHDPNVDGVLWFVNEVLPLVKSKINIRFYIIGSKPPEVIKQLATDDVIVTGFVSDDELLRYYEKCRVVVVPLRYGAGIKGKVVEALSNGLPIVTTSIGAEGLVDAAKFMLIADDPIDMADSIVKLYGNSKKISELSTKGPEYCRQYFSQSAVQKALGHIFDFGGDDDFSQ